MIYWGEDNEVVWYLIGGSVLLLLALLMGSMFAYRFYKPNDASRISPKKAKPQAWVFVFVMFAVSVGVFNYSYRYYYNPPFFVCPKCETKQRFLHSGVWNGEWDHDTNGKTKVMVDAVNCEECLEYFQDFQEPGLPRLFWE